MRKSFHSLVVVGCVGLTGLLAGCSDDPPAAAKVEPAVIDTIPGKKLKQVTLTPDGAERISLATGAVAEGSDGLTVPYSAVIWDPDGLAWAYVEKGTNVFVREEIVVDRIEGDTAYLSSGPAAGTKVAVVGVAELFGAETGIGK